MSDNQLLSNRLVRTLLGGLLGAFVALIGFLILFVVADDSPVIGKVALLLAALVWPLVCVSCGVMLARRKSKSSRGPKPN